MLRREKGRAEVEVGDSTYTMIVYRETQGKRWDDKNHALTERILIIGPRNTRGVPTKEELEAQTGMPVHWGMADLIGLLLRPGKGLAPVAEGAPRRKRKTSKKDPKPTRSSAGGLIGPPPD